MLACSVVRDIIIKENYCWSRLDRVVFVDLRITHLRVIVSRGWFPTSKESVILLSPKVHRLE